MKVSTGACAGPRAKVGLWRAELADRRRGIRAYWNSTCRPIVSTATTTMASSGTPSPAIAPPVEARDAGTSRRAGAESSRLSGQDDLDHRAAAGVVIDVPGFAGWVLSRILGPGENKRVACGHRDRGNLDKAPRGQLAPESINDAVDPVMEYSGIQSRVGHDDHVGVSCSRKYYLQVTFGLKMVKVQRKSFFQRTKLIGFYGNPDQEWLQHP